jgi:D-alanyl-D-alanine carboxypeptidase
MSDLENSREEFVQSIEEIVESLRGMGVSIDAAIDYNRRNLTDAQRQAIAKKQFEKERDEFNKKFNKAINETSNAVLGFGKTLMSSPGSFAPLKTVVDVTTKAFGTLVEKVPFFGGALKALGDAAGETAKMMIDSFQQAYTSFEKIAESGVVNTFDQMKESALSMGLTFSDTEKVLTKVSKDLALIGGSATAGRKTIDYLGAETEQTRRIMQRLGVSASDYSEFLVSYTTQQQRYTRGQIKDYKTLAEGSEKYIKELDLLSKLTGVNRKQLQTEQEARLRDTRYRAGIATLGDTARKEIDVFLGLIKQIAPEMEDGFKDVIASGGVLSTEASKSLAVVLAQAGIDIRDISKQFRAGNLTGIDAVEKLAEAAGKATNKTELLARIRGDETMLTKYFVGLRELELRKGKISVEQYNKERTAIENAILSTEGQNAALADTKTSLYNTARQLELLMTSSEIATSAMKWFAEGIETLTEKIYEVSGGKLPEHVQAAKDLRKIQNEKEDARKKLSTYDEDIALHKQRLAEEKEKLSKIDQTKPGKADEIYKLNTNIRFLENAIKDYEGERGEETRNKFKQLIAEKEKSEAVATKKLEDAKKKAGISTGGIPGKPEGKEDGRTELQKTLDDIQKDTNQKISDIETRMKGSISLQQKFKENYLKEVTDKIKKLNDNIENEKDKVKKEGLEKQRKLLLEENRKLEESLLNEEGYKKEVEAQAKLVDERNRVLRNNASLQTSARADDELKRRASSGATPAPNTTKTAEAEAKPTGPTDKPISIKDAVEFNNDDSGSESNYSRVQQDVKEEFEKMAKEYYRRTGQKLHINSSWRSPEEQKKMYDESVAKGRPGKTADGNPIAKPGSSNHEIGRAFDLNRDEVKKLDELGILGKFKRLDNDPPHIYMKDGGVINAKPGGTKVVAAEAGMNEAFVPLPNGKSIPVEIKNNFMRDYSTTDNSDLIASLVDTKTAIERSNSQVVDRLEKLATLISTNTSMMREVTDVLQTSKRIQSNMLQNSMI